MVVRLGQTRLDRVSAACRALAENGIKPVGFAIVGAPRAGGQDYHYYAGVSGPETGGPDQRQPRKLFGVR